MRHSGYVCQAAVSRAWTNMGAADELRDGLNRYLVTACRSRDISENCFVRVIPMDAAASATVRADGMGSARWLWRQCRAPARTQSGREHGRERIAPPTRRGPPQVAERQGARVLLGCWITRHRGDGDWTFRNGAHAAPSLRVESCPDLSAISVGARSQCHPAAPGSSGAGPWGGSAPTRRGGYRDLTS
jgi:hypothetical protein